MTFSFACKTCSMGCTIASNMAYEFADDDLIQDIPTTPNYWHLAAERIFQIVPFTPLFVQHYSVIEDPKTYQLGLDTNDRLPEEGELEFGGSKDSVGIMRVETLDSSHSGYLLDLRYVTRLMQRSLEFDELYYSDDHANTLHKTVPVVGAIFHDPQIEQLRLKSKYRGDLMRYAVGLISFVDEVRASKGASVWATKSNTDNAGKPREEAAVDTKASNAPTDVQPKSD